jgi:hypothetical protein
LTRFFYITDNQVARLRELANINNANYVNHILILTQRSGEMRDILGRVDSGQLIHSSQSNTIQIDSILNQVNNQSVHDLNIMDMPELLEYPAGHKPVVKEEPAEPPKKFNRFREIDVV